MRRLLALFFMALFACAPATTRSPLKTMTGTGTLFIGGTVATGSTQTPHRDYAVYAEDGVIREVGPASALRASFPHATVVDASGSTILPGLTDAHGHLYGLGLSLDVVRLVDTQSYD